MRRARVAANIAICVSVIGMMLVVGGVLRAGLFLPGVVLIGAAMVGFLAAGVLTVLDTGAGIE